MDEGQRRKDNGLLFVSLLSPGLTQFFFFFFFKKSVKSDNSKIFNNLKTLNSVHRILLTGTPLNNNIRELFNLLNFLDQDSFKDLESMEQEYADLNEAKIQKLHQMIKPYILRRIKADVLNLPPKVRSVPYLANNAHTHAKMGLINVGIRRRGTGRNYRPHLTYPAAEANVQRYI